MMSRDEEELHEASDTGWAIGAWSGMILLGWIVFEITAQPRYGIAVTCFKFAWNDVLNALWWLRRDPIRGRGVTGLFLCLSRGVFKWSAASVATCIALMIYLETRGPNQIQREADTWFLSLLIGLLLFVAASLLAGAAFVAALVGRGRLWIDSGLTWSRRLDLFPPVPSATNSALWMIVAFAVQVSTTIGLVLMATTGEQRWAMAWPLLALAIVFAARSRIPSSPDKFWERDPSGPARRE